MTPKFHVGQRVRIKRTARIVRADLAGLLGAVVHITHLPGLWSTPYAHFYGLDTHDAQGNRIGASESALEPVYDGDEPSTWQEFERLCGFNPARVPASAG